jgi:hypothetical protein
MSRMVKCVHPETMMAEPTCVSFNSQLFFCLPVDVKFLLAPLVCFFGGLEAKLDGG